MEFKDKLKELRIKNNFTQTSLGEKIYVSRSAIAKWENGLGLPSSESIDALCNIFNVSKDELLCSEQEEENYVKKNKVIYKQKKFIIGLIASVLLLIIGVILIIILRPKKTKLVKQETITYIAPAISINDNKNYYYTNYVTSNDESLVIK
ncbi:MAG: helix-turn-helix domain-containing protein, partial [Acholeplasmatales bacterium]|nr:helix-turn-helix domain-containing protein [Acholeplasmatales bacterium]